MQQLAPLDAIFLSMETPTTPGHIGGVTVLDPTTAPEPFDFDRFCAFVEERLPLCPRFTWRLREIPLGLDLPYWVRDEDFRVADHIRRVAVNSPGGNAELCELTGFLFERPLDRDRPLWEMFFIEGLQGGRVAMLWKMHHCLMDGVSGAGLVEQLFDVGPEPAQREPLEGDAPMTGVELGWLEMSWRGLRNAVARPIALGRHLAQSGAAAYTSVRSGGLSALANAPRMSFNGEVGPRRKLAWTSVSLEEIKAVKNHFGVTVNDVVLALTGSALRRYLDENGELPDQPLTAMIPISTRAKDDDSIGNQVSQAVLSWATHLRDPVERLMTVHDEAARAKETAQRTGANVIALLGEAMPPALTRLFTRAAAAAPERTPLPGNAVVSNVRFADFPLYIAGARIERMVPISVLAPSQGLNITAISYCGDMHFGLTVDPDLVPDVGLIADGIPKALTELWEASAQ